MRRATLACAMIAATMTTAPSFAQDAERYQLQRTPDGYVRLDTRSGRMSLCQERANQLVCRMATEERDAHDRNLDALEERIDALESRIAALEAGQPGQALPSEEEFEQTLGYMERFFRRFMGIVSDMDKRFGEESAKPDEPPADRT